MEDINQPVWLKIMQNGSVGEARTKAFLLDRFWVLERSVDIDGADFLIQPRSLGTRFTDRSPPRIGVVQAKYFQDARTVHHIPRHYVLDQLGFPLSGFFAILHLGAIDDAKIYMLSAEEMANTLDQTSDGKSFIVNGKALADAFRVDQHRRQALDRIEHAIRSRSFDASLSFLDRVNVPFRKFTADDIDYRYKLPIPNSHTDIPKTYFEYRDQLNRLTWEIEQGITVIDRILQESDPRKALEEREKLEEYRYGQGISEGLTFSRRKLNLDWEYLPEALDEHDARTAALEAIGKLQPFVDLSYRVREETRRLAIAMDPVENAKRYLWLQLDYNLTTLAYGSLRLSLKKKQPDASKMTISRSAFLHEFGGKADIVGAASTLWHNVMTFILFALCPALKDEDDD